MVRRATGTGFIYKIDNNPHRRNPYAYGVHVDWRDDGTPIRKILGYAPTKTLAKKELDKFVALGSRDELQDMNFCDLYNKWYTYKLSTGAKETAMAHYKKAYNKLSVFNRLRMCDLTLDSVQQVINNSGLKTDGQKRIRNLYSQLYQYAKVLGINVGVDFSSFLVVDKEVKSEMHTPFSKDEICRLWSNRDSFVDVILFMIYTGIRPNELYKIDFQDNYIITGSKTEAGMNRSIPIHDDIKCIDLKLPPKSSFYALFRDKMEQLGLSHYPYDTRHTFATMWKLSGADDLARKKIMGHSERDLTNKVYTHLDLDFLIQELNKVSFK